MKLVRRSTSGFAVLLALAACGKKDDKAGPGPATGTAAPAPGTAAPAGGTAAPAPGTAAPAPPAVAASAIKVDDELMAALQAVAACNVEPKDMKIECAAGEDKKLDELLGYNGRKQVEALPTLAVALGHADPKLQTVAADALSDSRFTGAWGEGVAVGAVTKDVAAALRDAVGKLAALGPYQARRAIPAVMHASALADQDAEAHALLAAHGDEWVRNNGWKASTLYGRMKAFPKLEAMAAANEAAPTLLAATALNSFYKLQPDEAAVLCPWAHGKLTADAETVEESEIFGQAGAILTKCRGEWIDKLLDFGEAQRGKKKFDRQYYFVFREMCHDFIAGLDDSRATPAQCERNFKFLEAVGNTEGVAPQHRAWALSSISYQRRDAKSLALMKKYAKHKVPEIKAAAAEEIKMLEGSVK